MMEAGPIAAGFREKDPNGIGQQIRDLEEEVGDAKSNRGIP